MPPDLDTLRLRALGVPGVTRLADHHDGTAPLPRSTSHGALRVFDHHVEIDIFLAAGHAVTTTADAVRAALAPLLAGHDIHVTVIDVDTTARHPDPGGQDPDPGPVSPDAGEPLRDARAVARAVLTDPESLVAEGLPASQRRALTGICRILVAYDVDPVSRRVLLRRLRHLLTAARGPHSRGLVDRLDAHGDTDGVP